MDTHTELVIALLPCGRAAYPLLSQTTYAPSYRGREAARQLANIVADEPRHGGHLCKPAGVIQI